MYIMYCSDKELNMCDSGSAGRVRPCQGRGRGFEPRLSLSFEEEWCKEICIALLLYSLSEVFSSLASMYTALLDEVFSNLVTRCYLLL